MAWLQVSFFSTSLMRSVPLNILIPADSMGPGGPQPKKPYKSLYLLHGYMGNCTDWILNTDISGISQQLNLCVIMPSGENSFYVDHPSGMKYGEYVSRELVDFTRRLLPLSDKREDTIIAGLSMGGYGAIRNSLKYPDVFGYTIALSSALILNAAISSTYENNPMGINRGYYEAVFGDLDKLKGSDMDPERLAEKIIIENTTPTDLYIACGYNDALVFSNRELHSYLDKIGYPHKYEEGPGTHEWPFWKTYLRRGLGRIPGLDIAPEFVNPFWIDAESK